MYGILVGVQLCSLALTEHERRYEEYHLRQFFGNDYPEYAARVPSGIPFVR